MAVVEILPRWVQQDWMEDARCKGETEFFFAPHGEQAEARELREAVASTICAACEVDDTCREYARRNREQGYWGGENDDQRIAARRRANRARLAGTA
jgi:WhiB family redox-sensing transcriptional regulator